MSVKLKNWRGDTLVEVLLSMALLTLILLTTWGLTNRSTQSGINSRKRIEMVNQLKEQAEILKSKYSDGSLPTDLSATIPPIQPSNTTGTDIPDNPCDSVNFSATNPAASSQAFHFNDAAVLTSNRKAVKNNDSYVWLQWVSGSGYRDFYVRGCWQTVGGSQKTDNSQFVVRLNQ